MLKIEIQRIAKYFSSFCLVHNRSKEMAQLMPYCKYSYYFDIALLLIVERLSDGLKVGDIARRQFPER